VQLKYVNTDLATLAGGELLGELDASDWVTVFAAASYVDGRDRTRNGSFATKQASPGSASRRDPGKERGDFSDVDGAAEEPLPGIAPLESRLGFRVHEPVAQPRWSTELSVRLVDDQDRIATSLLEQPSPGFAVWDARAYWQARDNLLLVIGVENFTNRNYREHFDFRPQPGSLNRTMYQPGVNFYFGTELTY